MKSLIFFMLLSITAYCQDTQELKVVNDGAYDLKFILRYDTLRGQQYKTVSKTINKMHWGESRVLSIPENATKIRFSSYITTVGGNKLYPINWESESLTLFGSQMPYDKTKIKFKGIAGANKQSYKITNTKTGELYFEGNFINE